MRGNDQGTLVDFSITLPKSTLVPAARDAPRPLDLERLGAQRLAPLHQRLAHGPHLGALALAHFRVRVRFGGRLTRTLTLTLTSLMASMSRQSIRSSSRVKSSWCTG